MQGALKVRLLTSMDTTTDTKSRRAPFGRADS